ncbi:hypothetical protein TNCV_1617121 [Trichonephila clavipes]|nr:hypothetical protein TNCV_1617121 [Trichonephila clavipes]
MKSCFFSDELKCTRQSDSRRVFTFGEKSEGSFHPSCETKIDIFGGKGMLVCGGIMLGSRTPLYVFDACTVNSHSYRDQILEAYNNSYCIELMESNMVLIEEDNMNERECKSRS